MRDYFISWLQLHHVSTPVSLWSPKVINVESGQYLDGWPFANSRDWKFESADGVIEMLNQRAELQLPLASIYLFKYTWKGINVPRIRTAMG